MLLKTLEEASAVQGGSLVSPALFSSMGASLGISPFQQALLNFTPGGNGHSTPRSNDGALPFSKTSCVPAMLLCTRADRCGAEDVAAKL